MAPQKPSSHLGAGMMVGAIIGMATGLFLQSRKGKELTKDAQKLATTLQTKLVKKLQSTENLTKDAYMNLVDETLAYYMKSKQIAKKEVPAVRSYLLARWKSIESQLKSIN